MKRKAFLTTFTVYLLVCLLFTGCKTEQTGEGETTASVNEADILTDETITGEESESELPEAQYASYISADYPWYNGLNELYVKADLVVIGVVMENTVTNLVISDRGDTAVYTVSDMEVETVIKGAITEGDIVEVKQAGGWAEGDDTRYIEENVENLIKGYKYLLFLVTYDNSPASLLNPIQAMYFVNDEEIVSRNGNDFSFTYEELLNLK